MAGRQRAKYRIGVAGIFADAITLHARLATGNPRGRDGTPGPGFAGRFSLLFRANESAFVDTKRNWVDECKLWAILSLPGGVFSTTGAGVLVISEISEEKYSLRDFKGMCGMATSDRAQSFTPPHAALRYS
jgi:hypothetical protein